MITLSNGYSFEYVTASGALGYDGLGWPWEWPLRWLGLINPSLFANVMKTVTLLPRKGNLRWWHPWTCVKPIQGGAVNAVGLTNPGLDWWMKKIAPKIDSKKVPLIGSIYGENVSDLRIMASTMNDANLVALEVNLSCPNTDGDLLSNANLCVKSIEAVKDNSRHPVWAKLSVVHEPAAILSRIQGIVEAININSVPWRIIFPKNKSPLRKLGGGGVSGKIAQPFTWGFAKELQNIANIPVIAPSVWNFEDLAKLRGMGFRAFSFGSVFLCHPWRPTLYVQRNQLN